MESCPCGSGRDFEACCRPFVEGGEPAPTAEALMRSRYTAHVKAAADYIYDTTHPKERGSVDRDQVLKWSNTSEWMGLEIVDTQAGGPDDEKGTVEFVARYRQKGKRYEHQEIAEFVKEDGRWYFMDGKAPQAVQFVRQGPKVGRNDPCSCGSGKKYKKCCAG